MARKVINYDDWLRTRSLVEARTKRILAFFDLSKIRQRPGEGQVDVRAASESGSYRSPAGDER